MKEYMEDTVIKTAQVRNEIKKEIEELEKEMEILINKITVDKQIKFKLEMLHRNIVIQRIAYSNVKKALEMLD